MDRELLTSWSLSFSDLEFVEGYRHAMRIGLAIQLLYFRGHGYFPTSLGELSAESVVYVAEQLGENTDDASRYDVVSDTGRRHRLDILRHLGFRRANERDRATLRAELISRASTSGSSNEDLIENGYEWAITRSVFIPSRKIMERLVRSAQHAVSQECLALIYRQLSAPAVTSLEVSLAEPRGDHGFQRLKDDVGAATLDNVLEAADRLGFIQSVNLPFDMLSKFNPSLIKMIARRVEGETASEMRRHAQEKRLGL